MTALAAPAYHSLNRVHVPAVDHLRAFLASLIVVYHGWHTVWYWNVFGRPFTPNPWPIVDNPLFAALLEGHTAVSGFMVLSGFIFVHGTSADRVNYGAFLRNRLLRIYPLYLTVLSLGVALNPGQDSLLGIVRYVLPLANLGPAMFGPPASMAWAVAVEFQFYLIFPFLFLLLNRHGPGLLPRMVALMIVLRLLLVAGGFDGTALSYWTLAGRIDQFLFGMMAGYWMNRRTGGDRRLAWQVVPAALAIVAALAVFHRLGGWPTVAWWRVLVPTVEGVLWAWLIVAYVALGPCVPALISRGLVWVGQRSFSMYLLHLLVIGAVAPRLIVLTGNAYVDALLVAVLVILPASVALAALSFATIESVFLGLRRRYVGA